jgi:hypothetical protein
MKKPVKIVLAALLGLVLVAALAALGPVHRRDIPTYWSMQSFFTILLGPLSVFFAWPKPSLMDYVGAVLAATGFLAAVLFFARRPQMLTACVVVIIACFWLLLGLSAAFAWI